jgi:hypothetical protein
LPSGQFPDLLEIIRKRLPNQDKVKIEDNVKMVKASSIHDFVGQQTGENSSVVRGILFPSEDISHVRLDGADYVYSDILFAVINKRGRPKDDIRALKAEIQRFGNRKLGAVTISTDFDSLHSLIAENEAAKPEDK